MTILHQNPFKTKALTNYFQQQREHRRIKWSILTHLVYVVLIYGMGVNILFSSILMSLNLLFNGAYKIMTQLIVSSQFLNVDVPVVRPGFFNLANGVFRSSVKTLPIF